MTEWTVYGVVTVALMMGVGWWSGRYNSGAWGLAFLAPLWPLLLPTALMLGALCLPLWAAWKYGRAQRNDRQRPVGRGGCPRPTERHQRGSGRHGLACKSPPPDGGEG